jgi:hypothetical protein
MALNEEFEESQVKRRLFIEPTAVLGTDRRNPDLMICNSRSVIGVVEFKYLPKARPSPRKDIDTLKRLCNTAGEVTISNERYRGPSKPRRYTVAQNAVFCWAAVYSSPRLLDLPTEAIESIGGRFIRLDALTQENGPAEIGKGCMPS